MAIDVSGLNFFMPVFSFLFVLVIVYAILDKIKIIGDSKPIHLLISFIFAVVFLSVSSLELYVRTIIPWFVVLFVISFLVLIVGMFSSKDWAPKTWLAWVFIGVLILIFLIAAIQVFNPVFHPDDVIVSGRGSGVVSQIREIFDSRVGGTVLLLVIAGIVAWVITKTKK